MRFGGLSDLTDVRFRVTVKTDRQLPSCLSDLWPDSDDLSQIVTLSLKYECWEVIYNYY